MSRISTKNVGINKMIQPGNVIAKINSITLENSFFKIPEGELPAYDIVFNIEGPDLGPDFDGFFIDKDDQSKGKHKGIIGKVKADKWPFKDGVTKFGTKVSRDREILKFIKNTCKNLDIMDWFDAEDNQHDTINTLVEKLNSDGLFKDKWLRMCIAGKEYTNKGGFTNYELSFPKFTMTTTPFELDSISVPMSKLIPFDPLIHMEKKWVPKAPETLQEFEEEPKEVIVSKKKITHSDFEL